LVFWKYRKYGLWRSCADRLTRQLDAVLERHPQQRRGRGTPGCRSAPVREFAMRAVNRTLLLDQIEDRLLL
jgi:hypothetical protein